MEVLIPIFICAVLPIAIVLIVYAASINNDNKRTAVLLKALETDKNVDIDRLAESLQKPRKTERERLNLRLLRGCMFSFAGLALFTIGIVSLCMGSEFASDAVTMPLILGGISLGIGVSYLVVYFVTRKEVK